MSFLRLESVSYRNALKDVSLTVEGGEAAGVFVPHKVDRAALLSVCARIIKPQAGTVRASGRIVLAQRYRPKMGGTTVIEQLALPFLANNSTPRAAHVSALDLLTDRGLEVWGARRLDELEEHELVHLSLLRALAARPGVLLLDDPTAGYGLQLVDQVRETIRLARDQGAAVVVAASKVEPMTATTSLYGLSDGSLRGSRSEGGELLQMPARA